MAGEPSWEDIVRSKESGATELPPLVEPTSWALATPPSATPDGAHFSSPAPPTPAAAAETTHSPSDDDDPFAALFGTPITQSTPSTPAPSALSAPADGTAAPVPAAVVGAPFAAAPSAQPLSRRELREAEGHRRSDRGSGSGGSGSGGSGSGSGGSGSSGYGAAGGSGGGRAPRKRNLLWLKITLPIVIVLGLGAGAAAWAWANYETQIRELLGWELPNDFEGTGNGEEIIVTIRSGDIGADVARTLHDAGVTMTFDAVYDILLENPDIGFVPGNWRLQGEMSAQSAIDALQDPENMVRNQLLLIEGVVLRDALEIIAQTMGVPLADVEAAAADPQAYGVPANAPSLEGYLFPATYDLDGSETVEQVLQMLVDEMFSRLDALGVPVDQRHEILTKASLVQREAGPNIDDFYKVARVFQNRIDQGIRLESDATVAYGTGNFDTVWTTEEERADASNLYNTYVHDGLPIGPIGAPGEDAIKAAISPADGPWLFFVPVNLQTGETAFSETVEEHEAAFQRLLEWCDASPENASYCE